MPGLLEALARNSSRPRYAFMVLNLIAEAAGPDGRLGPFVRREGEPIMVRDWLCDAMAPMADRDPRRLALFARVREEMAENGVLDPDPVAAERAVEAEVRARVRSSGKTNISRAVTELVKAGMIKRHYQGYCVDHENRGAMRQVVYTLTPAARRVLQPARPPIHTNARPRQASLPF